MADAKGLEPLLPFSNQPFREALVLLYEHPLAEPTGLEPVRPCRLGVSSAAHLPFCQGSIVRFGYVPKSTNPARHHRKALRKGNVPQMCCGLQLLLSPQLAQDLVGDICREGEHKVQDTKSSPSRRAKGGRICHSALHGDRQKERNRRDDVCDGRLTDAANRDVLVHGREV